MNNLDQYVRLLLKSIIRQQSLIMSALAFSVFMFLLNLQVVVFSQTARCTTSTPAVTITGSSIAEDAYYQCSIIASLVVLSAVTTIGNFIKNIVY